MTDDSGEKATRRTRDLSFAIAVLLLAAGIAGVLLYGNWWRNNRLAGAYEARLQRSMREYQRVAAAENPDRDQVYLIGAEIDVVMRRIAGGTTAPEKAWRNFEFLRQHTHRLESLFSDTPDWNNPTLLSVRLGEIKRRIGSYENRSDRYLAEAARSKSKFGYAAKLQQIEDSLILSGLGQNPISAESLSELLTQTSRVLVGCLDQFAETGEAQTPPAITKSFATAKDSGADPYESELTNENVLSRGIAIATWLTGQHGQGEKVAELERLLREERRNFDSSKSLQELVDNRAETLLAISQLMVSVGEDQDRSSVEAALKRFDRSYRYKASDTDGILGQAMEIRLQAVNADWAGVTETVSALSHVETVSKKEVAFLRNDASLTILKLLRSEVWLDRIDTQLQIEKGLEMAVNLSRYSTNTFKMLMAIGVTRGMAAENSLKIAGVPLVDSRIVEAAKASPSSIIAMTTEAIAAGIKQDDVQLSDVVASETMLNAGLIDMLANMATWRLFAHSEADAAEVKLWVMLMESITLEPEANRQQISGTALLSLAGWQSRGGEFESATKTLESAKPLVGDTQLFVQVEDLVKQNRP
jgi:hypothetical protein